MRQNTYKSSKPMNSLHMYSIHVLNVLYALTLGIEIKQTLNKSYSVKF